MSTALDVIDRMSAADYLNEMGVTPDHAPAAEPKRSKWKNVPQWYDSPMAGLRRYASKKEANHARNLDLKVKGGQIVAWWTQWPIYCGFDNEAGTPIRMMVDFRILWADGSITFEDTKGAKPTPDWKLKQSAVRELHNIQVRVV